MDICLLFAWGKQSLLTLLMKYLLINKLRVELRLQLIGDLWG